MQRHKRFIIVSALLIFILACNIGTSTPTPGPLSVDGGIETAVISTLRAGGVMQATPVFTATPVDTPTPTITPLPTDTPTPSIPMASVSIDTSCRSGPGKDYGYLGALLVGETAQVVGKRTSHDYWIIKNPDAGGDCWLWGQYATINGNTDYLVEYAIPAVPTPIIPPAPSNFAVTSKNCGATLDITFSWTDNSSNEDGFKLYQDGGITHIIGYNLTSHALSLSYLPNQSIQLTLSAFNVTGESSKQIVNVICP